MSIFSDNLKILRARRKLSQQKLADALIITRGRYVKYEDGSSEPPIELLIRMSKFFHISIDLLLGVEINKYPLDDMLNLPDNRILLPVVVDPTGNNRIEIVPQRATMGYLEGYTDPGYIENLQTISLPFLRNGKYRAFPADGDSMPPYRDGTYIIGKYVEELSALKTGHTYIFVTVNEGITYKRLKEIEASSITVAADNSFYDPYSIFPGDILEVWEFACSVSTTETEAGEAVAQQSTMMFSDIKRDLRNIEKKIDLLQN